MDRLNMLLAPALVGRAVVRVQGSFAAGDLSEPEPDFSMLALGDNEDAHPDTAHLIIEVAQSPLRYDRGEGRAVRERGVSGYWIVNLVERIVEVLRDPGGGEYRSRTVQTQGDRLPLPAFPDVSLAIDDFLR